MATTPSHTLTAYRLEFKYRQRGVDEAIRQKRKNNEIPVVSLDDLITKLLEFSPDSENSERQPYILLTEKLVKKEIKPNFTRDFIYAKSGATGVPTTMYQIETKARQDFDDKYSALRDFHIFLYENEGEYYAIFHRYFGYGCKSAFLDTVNKVLFEKHIILEMEYIFPIGDGISGQDITKISLLRKVDVNNSTDIADTLDKRKKPKIKEIRTLTLDLKSDENNIYKKLVDDFKIRNISSSDLFIKMKEEINDNCDYNDAKLAVKIGRSTKIIPISDFDTFGGFDITEKLIGLQGDALVEKLIEVSDEYYGKLPKEDGEEQGEQE